MRAPEIGDIGDRIDLVIRRGASFGPHQVSMANPDGTPVNLTGASVRGSIRVTHDAATAAADLVVTMIDALAGTFSFELPVSATATLAGGKNLADRAGAHVWDMEIEYADGIVRPLYWGVVQVMAEATR